MYAFGIPHSFIKRPVICGQRACQRLIQIGIAQIFLGDIYHGWEFYIKRLYCGAVEKKSEHAGNRDKPGGRNLRNLGPLSDRSPVWIHGETVGVPRTDIRLSGGQYQVSSDAKSIFQEISTIYKIMCHDRHPTD
jgi:hypothetical protein